MNLLSISHVCGGTFCYCLNENELVINVKTNKDIDRVVIVQDDPYIFGCGMGLPWSGQTLELTLDKELPLENIWSITLEPKYKRLQYYFEVYQNGEKRYLFENGLFDQKYFDNEKVMRHYFKFAWMNKADIPNPPAWVKDTFWYQIFPERFCKGSDKAKSHPLKAWEDVKVIEHECFYGGDIKGAMSKLEFLKNLGVTGIYFNPLFLSPSNHKYNTTDYYQIDPDFGTNEELQELVDKAHSLGIKVMLDAVFNHSGVDFFAWQDVCKNGKNSKNYDWYFVNQDDFNFKGSTKDGRYYTFAFVDNMPKFNTNNKEVQDYCIDVCKYWIKEWHIDGIRFDVGNEVSHAFLKRMHQELRDLKNDIFLLGEIWVDSTPYMQGDEYDSVMNYPWMQTISNFFCDDSMSAHDFKCMMNYCYSLYTEQMNHCNFNLLDSHDISRFINRCGFDFNKWVQELVLLVTMPGSPCIYYGTEICLEGGDDPDNRRPMPWNEVESGKHDSTIALVSSLLKLRGAHKFLSSAKIKYLTCEGRYLVFEAVGTDETVKVYLNADKTAQTVDTANEIILFNHLYEGNKLPCGGCIITKL